MQITRIFHSGFLVETVKRYFIFDYYKGELPKLNPDIPLGSLELDPLFPTLS